MTLLVKFFRGTTAVYRSNSSVILRRPTAVRVPPVVTVHPRRVILNRREEIIQGICDDHVVIDGHEKRSNHARHPGAWKINK